LPFLRSLADRLRYALDASIAVAVVVEPDCPACHVDPARLHDAMMSLIVNARDAMPGGGRLQFDARASRYDDGRPAVLWSVSDSGCGMKAEVRQCATLPFFSTRSHDPQAGLGLAAVEGFARQSDGLMTLSSTAGEGTTVNLLLPQHHPASLAR
jgi:signal transduction histidine kinase